METKPTRKQAARKPKSMKPVPVEAFANQQLDLFQNFLANNSEQDDCSNVIDFWDSVPRYSVSRQKMNELRLVGGFLPIRTVEFHYRGQSYVAEIQPAIIRTKDDNGKVITDTAYYPSAREELIEHALRKLAADAQIGFFDKVDYRSGLRFTLYQLRQELAEQGHTLSYDQLTEGLRILALSSIEITVQGKDGGESFAISSYLPALVGVNSRQIENNRKSKWFVEFHPLVTDSINQLAYRQFNYERLMRCSSQLARWLLQQLVLKYTAASVANSFEMRYTTIKRDSALLDGYSRERAAIAALDEAWEELKELGALYEVKKVEQQGSRNRLEDAIYTVRPSVRFQTEQKAANRRSLDATETTLSVNRSHLLPKK